MKKLTGFCVVLMILLGFTTTALADENEIRVVVDGIDITFDQPPVTLNDRTMVPIRLVVEQLDCTVEWDGATQTVYINTSDVPVNKTAVLGDNIQVQVNNEPVEFPDQQPVILNGRTLLPVRFVVEKLGCTVKWDNGVWISNANDQPAGQTQATEPVATEQPSTQPQITEPSLSAQDEKYLAYVDGVLQDMAVLGQQLLYMDQNFKRQSDFYEMSWLEELDYQVDLLIAISEKIDGFPVEDVPDQYLSLELAVTQTFMYILETYDLVLEGYLNDDLYTMKAGTSLAGSLNELVELCIEARNI